MSNWQGSIFIPRSEFSQKCFLTERVYMEFESIVNWRRAQKNLKEGETHCGRILFRVGTFIALVCLCVVVSALV